MILRTVGPKSEVMSDLTSFRSIIELWGAKDAHGARIAMGNDIGVSAAVITKWWQRDSIPPEYWSAIVSTEKAAEAGATADLLVRLAAREIVEARA